MLRSCTFRMLLLSSVLSLCIYYDIHFYLCRLAPIQFCFESKLSKRDTLQWHTSVLCTICIHAVRLKLKLNKHFNICFPKSRYATEPNLTKDRCSITDRYRRSVSPDLECLWFITLSLNWSKNCLSAKPLRTGRQ